MDGRRRRAIQERFDLASGFLGFFTVAFFVITLVCEVTRRDALAWAIATLLFGIGVWMLRLARRSVLRRSAGVDSEPE